MTYHRLESLRPYFNHWNAGIARAKADYYAQHAPRPGRCRWCETRTKSKTGLCLRCRAAAGVSAGQGANEVPVSGGSPDMLGATTKRAPGRVFGDPQHEGSDHLPLSRNERGCG